MKATRIRLNRHSNGIRLTPAEFDSITNYDDRFRYELIDGVVIVMPIPSESEADPNGELCYLLRSHQEMHPQGYILDKTLPERYIRLTHSRRLADRVIWAGLGRLPDPENDTPTIAIEFVSRRKRDRKRDYQEKRQEYLAVGVKEYWVIDRFRRLMTVYQDRPGQPPEVVVQESEVYSTDLLPGFDLPLGRILALADQWGQ